MRYKILFGLFFAIAGCSAVKAQQALGKTRSWKPAYKDNKLEIAYRYEDCELPSMGTNKEMVFLQFTNLTDKDIKVVFELELQYGETCYNCSGGDSEFTREIILRYGETQTGACKDNSDKNLEIFSKFRNMANKTVLENYKIKNVVITAIN